jgi:hypothetical protein
LGKKFLCWVPSVVSIELVGCTGKEFSFGATHGGWTLGTTAAMITMAVSATGKAVLVGEDAASVAQRTPANTKHLS